LQPDPNGVFAINSKTVPNSKPISSSLHTSSVHLSCSNDTKRFIILFKPGQSILSINRRSQSENTVKSACTSTTMSSNDVNQDTDVTVLKSSDKEHNPPNSLIASDPGEQITDRRGDTPKFQQLSKDLSAEHRRLEAAVQAALVGVKRALESAQTETARLDRLAAQAEPERETDEEAWIFDRAKSERGLAQLQHAMDDLTEANRKRKNQILREAIEGVYVAWGTEFRTWLLSL
jgi:hypothetical protein